MATTITNVRVFDGDRMTPHTAVRFDENGILEVGDFGVGEGDALVDGSGGTLLPGLVDAHLHLLSGTARQAVTFGVTTVLDMFSKPDRAAVEKSADRMGDAADVRSSVIGATAPGGHPSMMYAPFPTVSYPSEAAEFVADQVEQGADYIKVFYDDGTSGGPMQMPSLSLAVITALVDAAHTMDRLVVAHVTSAAGARALVSTGVDVLGHVPMEPLTEQQIEAIAAAGVAVISTLSIADGFPASGRPPALLSQTALHKRLGERWRQVIEGQARRWMPPQLPDFSVAAENTIRLHQHGVSVLAGTDAPNPGTAPGASLHRELQRLVAAGMSPGKALSAATSQPADTFDLKDRGRIGPGLVADLLLVHGDPSHDIAHTQLIQAVWKCGHAVDLAGYVGSEAENASISDLAAQTDRVIAAMRERIPGLPPIDQ